METRAQKERVNRYKWLLKFQHMFSMDPRGLFGGLGLLWNQKVDIQILSSSPNFIHVAILVIETWVRFESTFVYGNSVFQQTRGLWDKLLTLHNDRNSPWCCIGDFNEMLSIHDKEGTRPIQQNRIELFRSFLDRAGLMDFELKGCRFTWTSNPRDGVVTKEKIDQVLFNWDWQFQYSHAIALALPSVGLDHSPIVLHTMSKTKTAYAFKFEAFWEDHEDCNRVIEEGYNGESVKGSSWQRLLAKSKSCKKNLQQWHKHTFKRANREIVFLKGKLNFYLIKVMKVMIWSKLAS